MTDMVSGPNSKSATVKWLHDHIGYHGSDCLIWPFSRNRYGYGQFGFWREGRSVGLAAHRYMCELVNGPPPSPKHQAAHSCGNGQGGCVNPAHLSWKTNSENQLDSIRHGTFAAKRKGDPRYKLTLMDVAKIRPLKGKRSPEELAEQYGVHPRTISKVFNGVTWKTV